MTIHKGEQYYIAFEVKVDEDTATPENVDRVRIKVGNYLCQYPNGELIYDSSGEQWLYPLSEEESFQMYAGKRMAEVAVMIGEEIFKSDIFYVDVMNSIITERWTDE